MNIICIYDILPWGWGPTSPWVQFVFRILNLQSICQFPARFALQMTDFQVVGSPLYARYPIYFFLLFEVLSCVKIQEKVWIYKYGFGTFQNIYFFRLFKYGGRVGKRLVKFCHPLQVAHFSLLLVQNSLHYVNIYEF